MKHFHLEKSWKQTDISSMTWGSHGSDYEDGCLLGCSAV
jgi:hypothetical protein